MNEYQEKIRTIGVSLRKGTKERKPVVNENDGTQAGYHVEHWDDRQDAVAQPKAIKVKVVSELIEEELRAARAKMEETHDRADVAAYRRLQEAWAAAQPEPPDPSEGDAVATPEPISTGISVNGQGGSQ